ncbi:MAG: nuclear transport factor 2 family protein [Tannerella sp.]|jgi:hypothetical protein|nr:nuclear transport factor 2 family protein [Tannerella sp.]
MNKIFILLIMTVMAVGCNQRQPAAVSPPQPSASDVAAAVEQLFKGMTAADEIVLQSITADELVYGHSSGKVQNKSEFIAEVMSGQPLVYLRIEPLEQTIHLAGNVAVVRHILTADTKTPEGEPGNLRIGNMMVWQLQEGTWRLLARQAYKL